MTQIVFYLTSLLYFIKHGYQVAIKKCMHNLYNQGLTSDYFIFTEEIEEIPTANCVRKCEGKGKFLFYHVQLYIVFHHRQY